MRVIRSSPGVVGGCCGRWAASGFSRQRGRGCSHPPALGVFLGIKGTPLPTGRQAQTPVKGGKPPLDSPFSHQRVSWEGTGGQDAGPTLSLTRGLRGESRSISCGSRCGGWAASAWSPQHGRGLSHPPALGVFLGIKGTPLEPRQREILPL